MWDVIISKSRIEAYFNRVLAEEKIMLIEFKCKRRKVGNIVATGEFFVIIVFIVAIVVVVIVSEGRLNHV